MSRPVLYTDNEKSRNFFESLQDSLIRRYSKFSSRNEPVVYEFTTDRALIHQYHVLLEAMYRRMYKADGFSAAGDIYDKISHILIARRGRLCLGGVRLTIREGDELWNLPMESDAFKLREAFADLPLSDMRHGELSRFAVMEDAGDEDIFLGLCNVMYEKVLEEKICYLFAKSNYRLARNWRLIANKLGARTTRICEEIEVPEHPIIRDEKWYVTLSNMTSLYKDEQPSTADAMQVPFVASMEKPRLALID